jgi:hypothetical protein
MSRIKDCLTDLQLQTNLFVAFHLESVKWIQHLQALSFSCWPYATSKHDWPRTSFYMYLSWMFSQTILGSVKYQYIFSEHAIIVSREMLACPRFQRIC